MKKALVIAILFITSFSIFVSSIAKEPTEVIENPDPTPSQTQNKPPSNIIDAGESAKSDEKKINTGEIDELDGNKIYFNDDGLDYITDLNKFWIEFREAVLNRDYKSIAAFVSFPLETRGSYDWDPIITVSEDDFESVFNAYLAVEGWEGTWFGTNFDFIEHTIFINQQDQDSARIGNMHLKKINNEWKIVFIYTD